MSLGLPSAEQIEELRVWEAQRAQIQYAELRQISAQRKAEPVWSGVLNYFARALRAISRISKAGNDKHNPGEPLRWAHEKSTDQPDCTARHLLTPYEIDPETGEMHLTHAAWRVCAWLDMVQWAIETGRHTREDFEAGRVDFAKLGKERACKS